MQDVLAKCGTEEESTFIDADSRSLGDELYVERYKMQRSDNSRRLGIFRRGPNQTPVNVTLYGFVKSVNLASGGDWGKYVQAAYNVSHSKTDSRVRR